MREVNFAYRLVLPLCVVLGATGLIAFLAWLIPIIGDFIHGLSEDDKWIHLGIVLFVGFSALAYYHVRQRKDDHDLLGRYDDKIL